MFRLGLYDIRVFKYFVQMLKKETKNSSLLLTTLIKFIDKHFGCHYKVFYSRVYPAAWHGEIQTDVG